VVFGFLFFLACSTKLSYYLKGCAPDGMHAWFLGVIRALCLQLMLLPAFSSKATIDVLNLRIEEVKKGLSSANHVPDINTNKANGVFKMPAAKAAHAKYLFCFYAVSIFDGFLSDKQAEVVRLTVQITLALASGDVFNEAMVVELDALIKKHHELYGAEFGADAVLPNFHTGTCFLFIYYFLSSAMEAARPQTALFLNRPPHTPLIMLPLLQCCTCPRLCASTPWSRCSPVGRARGCIRCQRPY
jgi:hypothetical protein